MKRFLPLAGMLLMMLANIASAGTVTYIYSDPQGTPLAEANSSGVITATFDYKPYGTQVLGTAEDGPGYTGHVKDVSTGLVYMQARYYDPAIGRFLSVDPVAPSAGDEDSINRYAYAENNPVRNIDPDGRVVHSLNHDNNKKILSYINSMAAGKYAFENDKLTLVSAEKNTAGHSAYYAEVLNKMIQSKRTAQVDVAALFTTRDLNVVDVQRDCGGGCTQPYPDGHVNSTVSGLGNDLAKDTFGNRLHSSAAEVFMHEIVAHAAPQMGFPDTGNGVQNENKVRVELPGVPLRAAEPKHDEGAPICTKNCEN